MIGGGMPIYDMTNETISLEQINASTSKSGKKKFSNDYEKYQNDLINSLNTLMQSDSTIKNIIIQSEALRFLPNNKREINPIFWNTDYITILNHLKDKQDIFNIYYLCNYLYYESNGRYDKYLKSVIDLRNVSLSYTDKSLHPDEINKIVATRKEIIEKNFRHKKVLYNKIRGLRFAFSILEKIYIEITSKNNDGFIEVKSKRIQERQISQLIQNIDTLVKKYDTQLKDIENAEGKKIKKQRTRKKPKPKKQRTRTKPKKQRTRTKPKKQRSRAKPKK
tara:strand:+ start:1079 stop:1912 length:834 start_codon:yes stop_codon:yes gene_type:complete